MGRRPKHSGQKLSKNRTFRVRGDLDAKLNTAAAASGRSVSEEIEVRLDRSFSGEMDNLLAVIMQASIGAAPVYEQPAHGRVIRFSAEVKALMRARIVAFIDSLPEAQPPKLSDQEIQELSDLLDRAKPKLSEPTETPHLLNELVDIIRGAGVRMPREEASMKVFLKAIKDATGRVDHEIARRQAEAKSKTEADR